MQTESEKLIARLPEYYREMHRNDSFDGVTFMAGLPHLARLVGDLHAHSYLDYGCGPKGGLSQVLPRVTPYDPYVPKYAARFEWIGAKFDVVFSSDVLEHMPIGQIADLLHHVKIADPKFVFLLVATRPASKQFPNGLNVHITVEPGPWWVGLVQGILHHRYVFDLALDDRVNDQVILGLRRRDVPKPKEGPCAPSTPPSESSCSASALPAGSTSEGPPSPPLSGPPTSAG